MAQRLKVNTKLNLNFPPGAVTFHGGALIEATLFALEDCGFPVNTLVVEITETECVPDVAALLRVVNHYRQQGVTFSLDDFGSGYAGLNLLADLQPEQLKLDMQLVRNINQAGPRQAIVRAIVRAIVEVCADLGITTLAEGVETAAEFNYLRDVGFDLFQGYYLARPGFEHLPTVSMQECRAKN